MFTFLGLTIEGLRMSDRGYRSARTLVALDKTSPSWKTLLDRAALSARSQCLQLVGNLNCPLTVVHFSMMSGTQARNVFDCVLAAVCKRNDMVDLRVRPIRRLETRNPAILYFAPLLCAQARYSDD